MTDSDLARAARTGDPSAFTELVRRHYDECRRYAERMLGRREDAEDVLQESFLRAHRGLSGYREQEQFRAWLFRIVVNRCRTFAGRRRTRERLIDPGPPPDGADAGDAVASFALRDALQHALDRLDPREREAVLLHDGVGLDYEAMATLTGAGVSALKMRVARGRAALRPLLEDA